MSSSGNARGGAAGRTERSSDALDHVRSKGGFGKAQKRAYAQMKAMEELLTPSKHPPPAWLSDPSILPKKPPGHRPNTE